MNYHSLNLSNQSLHYHYSVNTCPVKGKFISHFHENFELIYVANGRGKYIVEGTEYLLHPHSLLIIPPREYHYVIPEEDCPYERFVINFDLSDVFAIDEKMLHCLDAQKGRAAFYSSNTVPPALHSLLELLQSFSDMTPTAATEMLRVTLTGALVLLSEAKPDSASTANKPLGARVVQYLNLHLTEEITLDDLANRFFVSKYHLCRAFKEWNGISIMDYLCKKRILLAKQMIADGESANASAYRVGFNEYSTFFRAYKKVIGTAPSRSSAKSTYPMVKRG